MLALNQRWQAKALNDNHEKYPYHHKMKSAKPIIQRSHSQKLGKIN